MKTNYDGVQIEMSSAAFNETAETWREMGADVSGYVPQKHGITPMAYGIGLFLVIVVVVALFAMAQAGL